MKQGLLGGTALTPPPQSAAPQVAAPRQGLVVPEAPIPTPDEQPNASKEEQAEYDQLVNNAYSALYDDMPTLLDSLSGAGDPVQGLAQTVSAVMSRMVDSARSAGKDFSEGVVMHAGEEVLEDLADLMKDAGIHDLSADQLESSVYLATEMYRDQQQGNIDPDKAAANFADLQEGAKSGALDQVVPGAADSFSEFSLPEEGAAPAPQAPGAVG